MNRIIFILLYAITGFNLKGFSASAIADAFQDKFTSQFAGGAASATASLAGSTATTEAAADASSELLDNVISKKITEMKPAKTPLDTILRSGSVRNVSAPSWKYEWYSSDVRGIEDTIAVNFDTSDSGTWESTSNVHDIQVTNIHIWNKDDNMFVQGVLGGDGLELVLHVVGVSRSTSTLHVIPVNGIGTDEGDIPDIAADTPVTRIGNSKSELDAQTDPYSIFPEKTWNYAQIQMCQVEESVYLELHKKEVPWGLDDFRAQSIYDMRRSMEATALWGARAKKTDPEDNDEKYFTGGITRYIDKSYEYTSGNITNTTFNGLAKYVFTGNSGSEQRIMFAGSDFIEELGNVDFIQKQIDSKEVEVMFGITFNKITTKFGQFLIRHHELLDYAGWEGKAIILDMDHIEKFVYKPMEMKELQLDSSGQRRAKAYRMDEAYGVALRYPDAHCIVEPAESGS